MGDHGDDFATEYLGIKFERLPAAISEAEIGYELHLLSPERDGQGTPAVRS